jgi:peptidyl-prolyl cis-trans isomerase A (cyclophilin A)
MLKSLFVAFFATYVVIASTLSFAKGKTDGSHIQPDNYYPRVKMVTSMVDIIV